MEESSSSSSTLSPSSSSFDSLSTSDLESPSTVLFPKYPSFSHRGKPPMVVGPRFFFSSSSDEGAHHHFLDSCHLCKKPIGGGRDIFMYRGDTPFCSEECRQEQIEIDEADETREKMSKKQSKSPASLSKSEKLHARASGTVIAS